MEFNNLTKEQVEEYKESILKRITELSPKNLVIFRSFFKKKRDDLHSYSRNYNTKVPHYENEVYSWVINSIDNEMLDRLISGR